MSAKDRAFLAEFKAKHGEDAMRNRAPVAISVEFAPGCPEFGSNDFYTSRSLIIAPVVDPVLVAKFNNLGEAIHRLGPRSWRCATGVEYPNTPFSTLLDVIDSNNLYATSNLFTRGSDKPIAAAKDLRLGVGYRGIREMFGRNHPWYNLAQRVPRYQGTLSSHPTPAHGFGIVTVNITEHNAFFSVFTHGLTLPEPPLAIDGVQSPDYFRPFPNVPLNLWPHTSKRTTNPRPLVPAEAVDVLHWLKENQFYIVDNTGVLPAIEEVVSSSVIVWPAHAAPAMGQVSVGKKDKTLLRALQVPAAGTRVSSISTVAAAPLIEKIQTRNLSAPVIVADAVQDVLDVAAAEPWPDPRLKPHQTVAVARHMATRLGFVNALDAGLGKTICSLVAAQACYERKLHDEPGVPYRSLVVVEANVRSQWAAEAAVFFPEAQVVTVDTGNDVAKLQEALASPDPVLVIVSYSIAGKVATLLEVEEEAEEAAEGTPEKTEEAPASVALPSGDMVLFTVVDGQIIFTDEKPAVVMSTLDEVVPEEPQEAEASVPSLLLGAVWDDLFADEAAALKNTSKQSTALWALRRNSKRGIPLTGTPIVSGLDDLGKLVAWARNDQDLFWGASLDARFDVTTEEGLTGFLDTIGPLVVRHDSSELEEELPDLEPTMLEVILSPEELALSAAALSHLKERYEDLMRWLDAREQANVKQVPLTEEEKAELRKARSAWLGGTTLARQAAADPFAVKDSDSAGALLLANAGYIEAATKKPSTKRTLCVKETLRRVEAGQKVLIFTEFASVARLLITDLMLQDLRVGSVLGGGGKARDRYIKEFQDGNLDVLVATSSGRRGLNLQVASTQIHYDLPWTPDDLRQRVGRSLRIGSEHEKVEVVFMVSKGTVEERVASLVITRSVLSALALDKHRGRNIANTAMGKLTGILASELGDNVVLDAKQVSLMEIARVLCTDTDK